MDVVRRLFQKILSIAYAVPIANMGLILCVLTPFQASAASDPTLRTASPPQAAKDPQLQLLGSTGIGTYNIVIPKTETWYAPLRLDLLPQCHQPGFCQKYKLRFAITHLDFSFAQAPRVLSPGKAAENGLPSLYVNVEAFQMQFTKRIWVSFGQMQLFRALRQLDEVMNTQLTVAKLSVPFGRLDKSWAQGGCFFDMKGPGFKQVAYGYPNEVPFTGLFVLGIQTSCQVALGSRTTSATLGYAFRNEISVGKSGNGTADKPGPFGALLTEHRFQINAGVKLRLPEKAQALGFHQVRLEGVLTLFYHMNHGCLISPSLSNPLCSNQADQFEPRAGIQLSLDFGTPKTQSQSHPMDLPYTFPNFGL